MASISSSTIIEDAVQVDGRRHVRERHVDNMGMPHDVFYIAEAEADVSAMLPIRAAQIVEQLEAAELAANEAEALNDA